MQDCSTSQIDRNLQFNICKQQSRDETSQNFQEQNKKKISQELQHEIKKSLISAIQISLQIDQMKKQNQRIFNNLRDQMKDQIEIIKNNEFELEESLRFNDKNSSYLRENKIKNKSQGFKKFKNKLKFQLRHNIIQKKIDSLIQSLELESCRNHHYPIMMKSFKLIKEWTYYSLNYNDKILIAGFSKVIQMFLFTRGELNQTDELIELQSQLNCLKFIPTQENYFVSGHQDGQIILWKSSSKHKFIQVQVYKVMQCINCMDCTSNVLAFGGIAGELSIWNLECSNLALNQSHTCSKDYVTNISLNLQGTKLICCLKQSYFIVQELISNNWETIQQIIGYQNVNSILQFDNHFLFQTSKNSLIVLYQEIDGHYVKVQTIKFQNFNSIYSCFGFEICQYKNGFVFKHGKDLYFFTYYKHQLLQLEFKMQFKSLCFDGCLSNNQECMLIQEKNILKVFKFC